MSRTDKDQPANGYRLRRPPAWFINHRWSAPDRMRSRVDPRRAVAEHRAAGVVDTWPRTDQHRHGALWDWN